MSEPLISVRGLGRSFAAGDETISVLRDVNIDIWPGELVAIMGVSGSGKSTLMNILGCLDRASSGRYLFKGRDVSQLSPDEQAQLRREHFGFIFQRYQLLGDLDAVGNVEVPAIYAGRPLSDRRRRAAALLTQLGLQSRLDHRPNELSGGQQQRVSVARALMNGGEVILADEPTGALDTKSSAELIALLLELNRQGHTIVMVTHDPGVAAHAHRVITVVDGQIASDTGAPQDSAGTDSRASTSHATTNHASTSDASASDATGGVASGNGAGGNGDGGNAVGPGAGDSMSAPASPASALTASLGRRSAVAPLLRLREAFSMAVKAVNAHRVRSFLTMLGIIIGIASVVLVVALGSGTQQKVLENISSLGTNTITVRAGSGFGSRDASRIETLMPSDADALALQPFTTGVSPAVSSSAELRLGNITASASINGVSGDYFSVHAYKTLAGGTFDLSDIEDLSQVAVIDEDTRDTFFPDGEDPIGKVLLVGQVPVRVIGVAAPSSTFGPSSLNVWVPYTTAMARISGQKFLDSIGVRIADDQDMTQAEDRISSLLAARHGTTDFFMSNSDTIRAAITSTAQTMTLLVSAIAVISLVVGGIGVMNIMLVSVTERTKEIGIRIAIGARRSDIISQFLIEAVLVCLVGGLLGVGLALGASELVGMLSTDMPISVSWTSILVACLSSTIIGVTFGFWPARSAAKLDPVVALSHE